MNHSIHTSERQSFRGCRRRWDWLFHDRWYPVTTAKPLEFGQAFHQAMEVYYEPSTWFADREVVAALAIKAFVDKCEKQRTAYLNQTQVSYLPSDVQQDYDERVELGKGMLNYFLNQVAPGYDAHFKPVKVEVAFEVPITSKDGEQLFCGECGAPITYGGRLDALVEDEHGDYWIVDWKTAATIRDRTMHLELNDQISSYVWALSRMGVRVRGFVYVEIAKMFPLPPKRLKQKRLGCSFSVSKSEPVEYNMYLRTIQEEDAEAYEKGFYDDFLAWLKVDGPTYSARYQIHKTPYQLAEIGHNIFLEAQDMVNPNLSIYPAPGRFACEWCAFQSPCLSRNDGSDYLYTLESLYQKRDKHYWDEKEASTESKGGE